MDGRLDYETIEKMMKMADSPFSDEILSDEALPSLRHFDLNFDGYTNPRDHLRLFESFDLLYRHSDRAKCRLFVSTLSKSALRWFNKLPAKSINNFDELRSAFIKEYRPCLVRQRGRGSFLQQRRMFW
ncbi:hypothetical protein CASFOL_032368 [Castilleja foliolosa]|uniref:Retrotransposon gag domain-containing protein n=1 Tax=Castilleja foliolosa TaxID=1961234 RepID=A0ABD3C414_9LAMI